MPTSIVMQISLAIIHFRATSGESSSVKKAKVPTKAALKSFEAHSSTTPIVPNNAKKAAIEVRGRHWIEDLSDRDSEDEPDAPVETEIEKLANKVKEKSVKEGTLGSPMVAKAVSSMVAKAVLSTGSTRKSSSPNEPCSSSSYMDAVKVEFFVSSEITKLFLATY